MTCILRKLVFISSFLTYSHAVVKIISPLTSVPELFSKLFEQVMLKFATLLLFILSVSWPCEVFVALTNDVS